MINGIKHRVVRLEQRQPDPDEDFAFRERWERARARARAAGHEFKPLTDERRKELRGKSISEILMMGRQRAMKE